VNDFPLSFTKQTFIDPCYSSICISSYHKQQSVVSSIHTLHTYSQHAFFSWIPHQPSGLHFRLWIRSNGRHVILLSHDAPTHHTTDGTILSLAEKAKCKQQRCGCARITSKGFEHGLDHFDTIILLDVDLFQFARNASSHIRRWLWKHSAWAL